MIRDDFIRMQAECRATMLELAKLFPGCFHPDGRPIIAELRLPEFQTPVAQEPQR